MRFVRTRLPQGPLLRLVSRAVHRATERVRQGVEMRQARSADRRHNRRLATRRDRILVLRHAHWLRDYNAPFLAWAEAHAPGLFGRIELRRLPCRVTDWDRYALFVPWLQDPLRQRFPLAYRQARSVEETCRARGIPILNPVERLSTLKSEAAEAMRAAGVRVPRMIRIFDPSAFRSRPGLPYPFFVREDHLHGGPMRLIRSGDELAALALESFTAPVAVEFVDVRGADGCYRKHRYVLFGDRGVPRHLIVSKDWVVHVASRVLSDATREEELAYVSRDIDPNHDTLCRARRALGFDWAAFDYAYDRHGRLVVFEANPFPVLWTAANDGPDLAYLHFCRDRLFSAMRQCISEKADSVRLPADLRPARRAV